MLYTPRKFVPANTRRTDTWHAKAACRKPWVKPEWFFGQDDESTVEKLTPDQKYGDDGLRARLVCAACPVFAECWAENRDAEFGIYAGTDEIDRKRMVVTAQRRVDREATKTGTPWRRVTIHDLPVPLFVHHVATGSTRVQIALYAFLRGKTMQEAAEVAELPEPTVRNAAASSGRYMRYAA